MKICQHFGEDVDKSLMSCLLTHDVQCIDFLFADQLASIGTIQAILQYAISSFSYKI